MRHIIKEVYKKYMIEGLPARFRSYKRSYLALSCQRKYVHLELICYRTMTKLLLKYTDYKYLDHPIYNAIIEGSYKGLKIMYIYGLEYRFTLSELTDETPELKIIKYLASLNLNIHKVVNGKTILHHIFIDDFIEDKILLSIVRFLLSIGINPNIKTKHDDTALDFAIWIDQNRDNEFSHKYVTYLKLVAI